MIGFASVALFSRSPCLFFWLWKVSFQIHLAIHVRWKILFTTLQYRERIILHIYIYIYIEENSHFKKKVLKTIFSANKFLNLKRIFLETRTLFQELVNFMEFGIC